MAHLLQINSGDESCKNEEGVEMPDEYVGYDW